MNRKSKIFLFIGCILVILVLQRLYAVDNEQTVIDDRNSNNISIDNPKNPKTAGYWSLDSVILIDGDATGVDAHNWTWVATQDWFGGGSGNSTHPYLLENITITVADASAGLTIRDSNIHFKLTNISITNTGNGDGLELNTVSNGSIISSNFNENNNTGIIMNNVNDTTIELTFCVNNTIDGIYAVDSNLNSFTVDCSGNTRYGILLASSDNNTVLLSEFTDNVGAGLAIVELGEDDSVNNVIYGNTFENNTINGVDNCTLPNQWDNGVSLGNVWDDYEGVDADDDLIGDTPYDISGSAGAQDNYPYCSDGVDVAVAVSGNGDGDRDLWEPVDIITLAILIGIFFGVFVAILVVSKFLISDRR